MLMLDVAVRKEVLEFILASEALLSPALRSSEISQAECALIAESVMNLSRSGYPWSKSLLLRYNA